MSKHLIFPKNPLLCTASKKNSSEKKEALVENKKISTKIKLERMGFSVFKF